MHRFLKTAVVGASEAINGLCILGIAVLAMHKAGLF